MGMTYEELSILGRLRKIEKCGPYSTFTKLIHEWGSFLSPLQVIYHSDLLVDVYWTRCVDRRKGEIVLLRTRQESTQDDDANACVPCGWLNVRPIQSDRQVLMSSLGILQPG